ncbi:MAG: GPW/gp25 family protein [Acidobacteriia bacterium]|nr:GPW/gp25 family protein [Terriglobia bacterium]
MTTPFTDFLGQGLGLPLGLDSGGRIVLTDAEKNIQQAIWIILSTAPGERVMRPDFGCGIHELVFAVNEASTIGRLEQEVRQALTIWEPRIDVVDVNVEVRGSGEVLLINIQYRVRSTNNLFNMVFPFYLRGGAQ